MPDCTSLSAVGEPPASCNGLIGWLTSLYYAVCEALDDLAASITTTQLPPGMYVPYAGATAPDGWLLCTGAAVSRTTYASLFAVIGTLYGVGDGSTTFNLPDMRGRVPAGKDNMGGTSANRINGTWADGLGASAWGGSEGIALTEANLPPHVHRMTYQGANSMQLTSPGAGSNYAITGFTTEPGSTPHNTASTGSGTQHSNVQPSLAASYIIKY